MGDVGEATVWLQTMAKTMKRLGQIRENVESDGIDVERYVMELSVVTMGVTKAYGRMFEQEHLRFTATFSPTMN